MRLHPNPSASRSISKTIQPMSKYAPARLFVVCEWVTPHIDECAKRGHAVGKPCRRPVTHTHYNCEKACGKFWGPVQSTQNGQKASFKKWNFGRDQYQSKEGQNLCSMVYMVNSRNGHILQKKPKTTENSKIRNVQKNVVKTVVCLWVPKNGPKQYPKWPHS